MIEKNIFDLYSNEYDLWFDENPIIYNTELNAIKSILPKGRGIEIGVGTGRFAAGLNIKDGIEPSPNMRKIAVQRGINALPGVGEDMPFEEEVFDFALFVTSICFLQDINNTLAEVKRVLKKNGKIVIAFIDKQSPLGRVYESKKNENHFYKNARFYSTEELLSCLLKSGFCKFEVFQTLYGDIEKIKEVQSLKTGYGKGGFVIIIGDVNGFI